MSYGRILHEPADRSHSIPFAINSEWRVITGNNAGTHLGVDEFCWDFGMRDGNNEGQPVYAVAPGEVVEYTSRKAGFTSSTRTANSLPICTASPSR